MWLSAPSWTRSIPASAVRTQSSAPSTQRSARFSRISKATCEERNSDFPVETRSYARQASVNRKTETVEDLQGRRKRLHIGTTKLAHEDLVRQLALTQASDQVRCLFSLRLRFGCVTGAGGAGAGRATQQDTSRGAVGPRQGCDGQGAGD